MVTMHFVVKTTSLFFAVIYRDMVHWLFVNCDQCRLVLLRKKPTLLKLCCAGFVLLGLILSLIPVIAGMDKESESGKQAWLKQPIVGRILWPLCFMFGFVSWSLHSIYNQSCQTKLTISQSKFSVNLPIRFVSCLHAVRSVSSYVITDLWRSSLKISRLQFV